MTIKLAERSDVLHITLIETNHECSWVEAGPGIVCRVDDESNEIVGMQILSFTQRAREGLSLPDLISGISAAHLLSEA